MSSPARGRGGARGKGRGGSRSANNSDDESVRQSARRTRANNAARTPSSIGLGRGAGRGLQGALGQVRSPAAPKRGNQSTRGNAAQSNGPSQGGFGVSTSRSANRIAPSVAERLKTLRKARENERQNAIAQGFLADPDRPRTLAEAVTPVGTCQDMCPEYERLQRIQQNDVWGLEYDPKTVSLPRGKQVPEESRMVKKFKRSAAGTDEQLPSDLRPPVVLQRTCDYLFNQLLNETQDLKPVHHFIWDRTRAIRNDFSIQQLTKIPDIRVATDCYERIARFHILSLHLVGGITERADKYDWFQDREQLDRTLLSLVNYYDNARNHYRSPNEAEFRAYCVIFQIPNPTADLEDRVQTWPPEVTCDPRVQRALKLYNAAQNISIPQGPLRERIGHPIAQSNWSQFWKLTASEETSYLMSCVAEINFNRVRRNALQSIWRSFRQGGNTKSEDWSLEELVDVFGFDEEKQVQTLVESYQFRVVEKEDGKRYLDLNSVTGKIFPEPTVRIPAQQFSDSIVEVKRCGRTLSALVNGLSTKAAIQAGMIMNNQVWDSHAVDQKESSLFVRGDSDDEREFGLVDEPSTSMDTIGRSTMRTTFASALTSNSIPATTIESSTIRNATGNSINTFTSLPPAASDPTFPFTVTPSTQATQTPFNASQLQQSFITSASGTPPVTLTTSAPSTTATNYTMVNEQGAPAPNQGKQPQQAQAPPGQSQQRPRKGISIFHRMTKLAFSSTGTNPHQHHHPVPPQQQPLPQQQQASLQQQRPLPDFQSQPPNIQQTLHQQHQPFTPQQQAALQQQGPLPIFASHLPQQQQKQQQQPQPPPAPQTPPGQLLPVQPSTLPQQQQPFLPQQIPLPESPPQHQPLQPQQIPLPDSPPQQQQPLPQQQATVPSWHSGPRPGKRKITDRIDHAIATEAQSQQNVAGPSGQPEDHRAKRPMLNRLKKPSSALESNPLPQQPQTVLQQQQPQSILQQQQSFLQQQQPQSILQQPPSDQQQQIFPQQQQADPQQPLSVLQQPQSVLQQQQSVLQQPIDVPFGNAGGFPPPATQQRPPRTLVFTHLGAPGSAEWLSKYQIRSDNIFGYLATPAPPHQEPPMQHATYLQDGGWPPQQQPMLNAAYPQDAGWNSQQQAFQFQPAPTLTPYDQYQLDILYAKIAIAEKAREDAEAEKASREKYHQEWMERYAAQQAAKEKAAAEKAAAEKERREQRLAEEREEQLRFEKKKLEKEAAYKIAEPIRKDEVQEYLGRQMALDLSWGVLPTYIYHVTRQLVKQEMIDFEDEQDRRQADEFRRQALAVRYFRRWYRNARSMRLRRRGQLYRARAKEIIKQKSQTPDSREVDWQKGKESLKTSAEQAKAHQIVPSSRQKQTDSSPNNPPQISTTSQPSEDTPSRHKRERESGLQNHGARAQPSTKAAARQSTADLRVNQMTKAASPALSTAASALSAPDSTGIPVIDLIRGHPRPDAKISTFKNPYFLFKSHGIYSPSRQTLEREAAKRKRETEDESNQTGQMSREPDSPPENKKWASESQMQHLRSLSSESRNSIQQVMQEFEESESWYRQTRDQLQQGQGLYDAMSGSTTSANMGTDGQPGPTRPQSVPKYRSRQSKFVATEEFGGRMMGAATRSREVTTVSRQEDEEQMQREEAEVAAALIAANRAENANGNGYRHSNRFAALAQDEDTEVDDEESEGFYEEGYQEIMEAEEEIEDDDDDDDDDDEIEIIAPKSNYGTGTGATADDAIELDSD